MYKQEQFEMYEKLPKKNFVNFTSSLYGNRNSYQNNLDNFVRKSCQDDITRITLSEMSPSSGTVCPRSGLIIIIIFRYDNNVSFYMGP